jgi:hypothetical protein
MNVIREAFSFGAALTGLGMLLTAGVLPAFRHSATPGGYERMTLQAIGWLLFALVLRKW